MLFFNRVGSRIVTQKIQFHCSKTLGWLFMEYVSQKCFATNKFHGIAFGKRLCFHHVENTVLKSYLAPNDIAQARHVNVERC